MEIRYLRVVNAQQAYDLANVAVQERDRARRDASTDLIALRTQLEIKYKTKLAPGTNLMPDGTIVPSPAPRAVRPLTPADFPQPRLNEEIYIVDPTASETPFPEPAP